MDSPLVSTDWLAGQLDNPAVKVIEVAAEIEDTRYREGHVPGAIRVFWKNLCWHDTDRQFVTPDVLSKRLSDAGISTDDTIVLCGDPVQYGTYAYWAMTMGGAKNLKLLDGAKVKWAKENHPVETVPTVLLPATYQANDGNSTMRLGRENVRENLGKAGRFLLDVRSPEEYSGERVMEYGKFDHGAERGGRIPGAQHLYFKAFLNDDDTFKSEDEIRTALGGVGATAGDVDEVVCYCRLSHRATLAWTAMTYILGIDGVKIYDGSWTEWGSIVDYPVEK